MPNTVVQRRVVRTLAAAQVLSGVGVAGTVAAGSLLVSSITDSETLAGLAQTSAVLGAAALVFGFYTRVSAIILAVFTLVASVLFHAFWSAPAEQAFVTQLLFTKNIAVIGGLLTIAAFGAGQYSLDAKKVI